MKNSMILHNFVNLNDLDDLSEKEILELSVKTITDVKKVNLNEKDISGITKELYTFTFDDVRKYIRYENDNSNVNEFKITLPSVDERSLEEYEDYLLPATGYFMKMDVVIKKQPMGLLKIKYKGFKSSVNSNDNRYLKDEKVFEEKVYFLFDFEKNIYQRVDTKSLEDSRRKAKTSDQINKIKNERVKEYIKREELIEKILGRLKRKSNRLTVEFLNRVKKDLRMHNLNEVGSYLKDWHFFYKNEFEGWLKLKLIYTIISEEEYKDLLQQANRIYKDIELSLKLIEEINLITKNKDVHRFREYSREYDLFRKIDNTAIKSIMQSIQSHCSQNAFGYFLCEREREYYLLENFYEIEKRRFILDIIIDKRVLKKEKKNILKMMVQRKKRSFFDN